MSTPYDDETGATTARQKQIAALIRNALPQNDNAHPDDPPFTDEDNASLSPREKQIAAIIRNALPRDMRDYNTSDADRSPYQPPTRQEEIAALIRAALPKEENEDNEEDRDKEEEQQAMFNVQSNWQVIGLLNKISEFYACPEHSPEQKMQCMHDLAMMAKNLIKDDEEHYRYFLEVRIARMVKTIEHAVQLLPAHDGSTTDASLKRVADLLKKAITIANIGDDHGKPTVWHRCKTFFKHLCQTIQLTWHTFTYLMVMKP